MNSVSDDLMDDGFQFRSQHRPVILHMSVEMQVNLMVNMAGHDKPLHLGC
jgi:hypothetical protein